LFRLWLIFRWTRVYYWRIDLDRIFSGRWLLSYRSLWCYFLYCRFIYYFTSIFLLFYLSWLYLLLCLLFLLLSWLFLLN